MKKKPRSTQHLSSDMDESSEEEEEERGVVALPPGV